MTYYSQYGQDKILNESVFEWKKNGVFLDIGAFDGVDLSNTYFFEKELGWTGICVEPLPEVYEKLKENRTCHTIHGAAWSSTTTKQFRVVDGYSSMLSGVVDAYHPDHLIRIDSEVRNYNQTTRDIEISCYSVMDLCKQFNINHIDLLSIDVEGSEFEILKAIDFDQIKILTILVENNYEDNELRDFLRNKRFELSARLGSDDLFTSTCGEFEYE